MTRVRQNMLRRAPHPPLEGGVAPRHRIAEETSMLTVTSPTSADVYEPGESVWVAWEPTSNSSYFDITLLYDGVQVDDDLCESGGCRAPGGAHAITLPTWLEDGTSYSILVGESDSIATTASGMTLYGESEPFEVVALGESSTQSSAEGTATQAEGTATRQFLLGAASGSAAVLVIALIACLIVQRVWKRRRDHHRATLRPKNVHPIEYRGPGEKDGYDSSDGASGEGAQGRLPSVSSMPGLDDMGTLSPVQEEVSTVITRNPMRAVATQGGAFESIGGQSSRREDCDDEDEETEGMFADAAVVAALAAAAAQRAQKPEIAGSPIKTSAVDTSARWGWEGSGWTRSLPIGSEESNHFGGHARNKDRVAVANANARASRATDRTRLAKAPIATASSGTHEHNLKMRLGISSRARAGYSQSASVRGKEGTHKTPPVIWSSPGALVSLKESVTRPVSPSDGSHTPQLSSIGSSFRCIADRDVNGPRNLLGMECEPQYNVSVPEAAEGGRRRRKAAEGPNLPGFETEFARREDWKQAEGNASTRRSPPRLGGQGRTDLRRATVDPVDQLRDLPYEPMREKQAVVPASRIDPAVEANEVASLTSEDEGDKKEDDIDQHDDASLQVPSKRSESQTGSPRRSLSTVLTPSLRSNISSNASSVTPDRLFVASDRPLPRSMKPSASWIASFSSSSSSDRTRRKSTRTLGPAIAHPRPPALWSTPVATPDRMPRGPVPPLQRFSHTMGADQRRRSLNTPGATPVRNRLGDVSDTRPPLSIAPERMASSELGSAAGRPGVSPTDEPHLVWQLDSPAGVDGMPSPKESESRPIGLRQTRRRAFATIFGTAPAPPTDKDAPELMPPAPLAPPKESAPRHSRNSSDDSTSSVAGWESEGRAEDDGFSRSNRATTTDTDAYSDTKNRGKSVRTRVPPDDPENNIPPPTVGPSDELFYSADADDEIMQLASKSVPDDDRRQSRGNSLEEAAEMAALVAEALALAHHRDDDRVLSLRRAVSESGVMRKINRGDDDIDVATDPGAPSGALESDEKQLEAGDDGIGFGWRGGVVSQEGDAERDAEEVQALIAEALALVNETSLDAKKDARDKRKILEL